MVSINYGGRLGNNMLQYAAAKIFSKKFKLKLLSKPKSGDVDFTEMVRFEDVNSEYDYYENETIIVNNQNFLTLLNKKSCTNASYVFSDYFQIREFVINYKEDIRNIFNNYPVNSNQVFVHYRIGDIEHLKNMLPINYYIESLDKIGIYGGIITSDSPNHQNVKYLSEKYDLQILSDNPVKTMILGAQHDNIILSEGTFSWWIGVLSNAKKIIYNDRDRFWHGDIFCYEEWIKLNYS